MQKLLNVHLGEDEGMYKITKRFFDITASGIFLILLLPVWIFAVLGIELSNPGPVFYIAKRIGQHNREFPMYKFRSMRQGKVNESVFRGEENRIFPFGKFIRSTKIDELPQLLNVFLGDMSFVGPRPAAKDQMSITRGGKYASISDVQVGLTSPSALYDFIYGDTVLDSEEYENKVLPTRLELDLWYVENCNMCLDIKMIWWTTVCVFASLFHKNTPNIYKKLVQCVPNTQIKKEGLHI